MKPVLTACLLLLLAGCVPGQRDAEPRSWVGRSEALAALDGWVLNGRIGVRLENDGFSGSLVWRQTGEAIEANISGPLGAGALRIKGQPGDLVLETGDGQFYLPDDPEQALAVELGWGIPVDAMRFWVIGVPAPGSPALRRFDDRDRLASLEQRGWRIDYERYMPVDRWDMPKKVVMTNDAGATVRLVISRWSLGTDS